MNIFSAPNLATYMVVVTDSNVTFGISDEAIANGLCYNSTDHPPAGERTKVSLNE